MLISSAYRSFFTKNIFINAALLAAFLHLCRPENTTNAENLYFYLVLLNFFIKIGINTQECAYHIYSHCHMIMLYGGDYEN